jgi:hypothetical protein
MRWPIVTPERRIDEKLKIMNQKFKRLNPDATDSRGPPHAVIKWKRVRGSWKIGFPLAMNHEPFSV